jgi:2-(3-amino-3-carboxypropyl)histidine synthase
MGENTGSDRVVLDNYLFDLSPLRGLDVERVLLEGPQGFVRLLPRLAGFIRDRFGVEALYRLEPSYGLCSVSLTALRLLGPRGALVHVGHDFYPYPFCLEACSHRLPPRVVTVPGEYLGGDPAGLAEAVAAQAPPPSSVALGYSAQHRGLAERLVGELEERGIRVEYTGPLLGCFFAPFLRLRGRVSAYVVVAGGMFHALGLGLALGGEGRILRADPYRGRVDDVGDVVARTLAKRLWAMKRFQGAQRVAVIQGMLPGQNRPGIVAALARLLRRRGIGYDVVLAERLSREMLDNLDPGTYDAYVVTSCPRLAVDDLGDYWKPVLAPGEAYAALRWPSLERYIFPW